jgi:methylsterol monooxygenase
MSFNTTSVPFQHDFYPGIDFSSLNWFEKQWAAWYIAIGDPIIATGLMSFIMHEVCLFPCYKLKLTPFDRLFISAVAFRGS